jgi:predicted dehydrogenase
MKNIRIGVVGLGMGASHVEGYREHPLVEVVAAVDTDKHRLKEIGKKKLSIPTLYHSMEEMIKRERPDIVSIAVPNCFHKDLAIEAMHSDCHVLCEKPMAMNAEEAEEMLKVSKETGKRLMINFSFRFTEQSFALKKQIESGIIGDIYFGRTVWHRRRGMPGFGGWFGKKEMAGGGPIIDLGVHRLDLALWLMDYPKPKYVLASTYNHLAKEIAERENKEFTVEDIGVAMIKFENGATLELEASWAANIKEIEEMSTRLLGTKGGLLQKNQGEGYEFEAEMFIEKEGCLFDMKLHPPVPKSQSSYYHFIDSIVNDAPNIATAEEGLTIMKILDAIYKSAETGKPVEM